MYTIVSATINASSVAVLFMTMIRSFMDHLCLVQAYLFIYSYEPACRANVWLRSMHCIDLNTFAEILKTMYCNLSVTTMLNYW
jgi:hypothetical protein